jgi:hypothetical protein
VRRKRGHMHAPCEWTDSALRSTPRLNQQGDFPTLKLAVAALAARLAVAVSDVPQWTTGRAIEERILRRTGAALLSGPATGTDSPTTTEGTQIRSARRTHQVCRGRRPRDLTKPAKRQELPWRKMLPKHFGGNLLE